MDDVIYLVKTRYESDEYLNQKPIEIERQVFCKVQSVGRTEFYQAAQSDMHPDFIFVLSHYMDYRGEKIVKYTDWMGREHKLYVTRAYRAPGGDTVELTCEERTGYGHESEPRRRGECCPDGICSGSSDSD